MSRSVTIDGQSYTLPTTGEKDFGANFERLVLAIAAAIDSGASQTHPAGILSFGAQAIVTGQTSFLYPGYEDQAATTNANLYRIVIPSAGTLSRLFVHAVNATNRAIVYTLMVNGSNSALAVTLAISATSGNEISTEVEVSAGDRIEISATAPGSTSPVIILPTVSVLFTPSAPSS